MKSSQHIFLFLKRILKKHHYITNWIHKLQKKSENYIQLSGWNFGSQQPAPSFSIHCWLPGHQLLLPRVDIVQRMEWKNHIFQIRKKHQVRHTPSMVAIFGWIIPEPFAIPPTLTLVPPTWPIHNNNKNKKLSLLSPILESANKCRMWRWTDKIDDVNSKNYKVFYLWNYSFTKIWKAIIHINTIFGTNKCNSPPLKYACLYNNNNKAFFHKVEVCMLICQINIHWLYEHKTSKWSRNK